MCGSRYRSRQGTTWIGYEVPRRRHEDPDIRASDADRERVAETLRASAADGRLEMDELDERLDRVYAAKTFGDLNELTRDLPAPRVLPERTREHRHRSHVPTLVWVSVLLVAIWAMSGFGYFWPMWPMLWFAFAFLKSRRYAVPTRRQA